MGWDDIDEGIASVRQQQANAVSEEERKRRLMEAAAAAGDFAGFGQGQYMQLGRDADAARQQLADIASGKLSYSGEQLRQGNMQAQAAQRSYAASASPSNAAMAARNAAMNMGRLQSGLSGQTALAGIAERQGAAKALQDAILAQRAQDMQVGLGSRGNQINALGAPSQGAPEKSWLEKNGPALAAGAGLLFSDRRLKTDIDEDDDAGARKALAAIKAKSYDYKDDKYGKGRQFGIMAQDLERAGLGHAVIDTPEGKMVHGAKLAAATTALVAHLNKRVSKLEGTKK